jgi:hypothetical protein
MGPGGWIGGMSEREILGWILFLLIFQGAGFVIAFSIIARLVESNRNVNVRIETLLRERN